MAKFEFKLPDIGEGVTEGEIVTWLVKPGDTVEENQEMVEVMTDKATVTIGAPKSGKIAEVRGKEGEVVPVGHVLVVFDLDGGSAAAEDEPAEAAKPAKQEPKQQQPEPSRDEQPLEQPREPSPRQPEVARRVEQEEGRAPAAAAKTKDEGPVASAVGDIRESLPGMDIQRRERSAQKPSGKGNGEYFEEKPLAAPATRKLARELDVDLRRVRPSGPGGRVTREDVERHRDGLRGGAQPAPEREPAREERPQPRAIEPARVATGAADERVPLRGLRKRIFENMARSMHTAAHFTYVDECDVGSLRALRERTKAIAERDGVKLSFLPFIVKAVVAALKRHPALNCLVDDAAQEMVLKKSYDIGIATATEAGLTVPVLRSADRLSILEISQEIERLASAARDGKIRREDLGGSSFTITSLGKLGGLFATPIVNYPEVAILGVHEMKRRPVVKGDEIVIGDVMLLSLSFDHRIVDGHVGAAFAREIIDLLEEPDRLLISMG
jgi:pyruvate dehydrogenase E2 component (dihydrolipoamide acetyltransferase)